MASILNDGWLLRLGKTYADGTSRESKLRQTAQTLLFSGKILCIRLHPTKTKRRHRFVFAKRVFHRCTGKKVLYDMRVLLNAISAKMGEAANFARNIVVELAKEAPSEEFIIILPANQARAIERAGQIFA